MVSYQNIQEFKKTEVRKGSEVTVIVWVPSHGHPYVHSVILTGDRREWSAGDPNRPSYDPIADMTADLERAFDAGFAYAEKIIDG